jgi:hypothetical protein
VLKAERRGLGILLAAAAPALLATAFLVGSTPDDEEFRFAVLASVLHVRELAQGTLPTWTSTLGFGIPLPLVPNFNLHPLVPLLAVVSPVTWIRLLYLAHTLLGATGMWQIGRALHLSPVTSGACVLTFMLATPAQNYLLTDLWPSHYLVWTSSPWLLLMAWRLLDATGPAVVRRSVALGVIAGLVLANTNPGHIAVYGALVLAVVAGQWRAAIARWQWLAAAAAMACVIAGPNLAQLALERTIFDASLGIVKVEEPLPPSAAWDVFLRPFSRSEHVWQVDVVARGTRTLFFGGPFAVLSLLGLAWHWRRHPALALGVAVTAVLLFTPYPPVSFASRFHFRDPLTLCAILLAGLAVDDLRRSPRTRPFAVAALILQVGVVAAAISPFLENAWRPDATRAMWLRGASGDAPPVEALRAAMSAPGRLAYSPQVDYQVSERARLRDGLGVNALAYQDVPLVNGSFKGASTDVLWPDDRLFYGRVRIPRQLIESDAGLDVLGIRYVLASRDEPVAPQLRWRTSIATALTDPLLLYENTDAGPGGFVMNDGVESVELPMYPDCTHDRLLCRDLTALAHRQRTQTVEIVRHGPRIDVTLGRHPEPGVLVLADMFRPEWAAAVDGRAVDTRSLGPGLLAVGVPAGATSVRLDYRPVTLIVATMAGWFALVGGLVALLSFAKKGSSPGGVL